MPKRKIQRSLETTSEVLGGRDVRKIQKLLRQTNDEEPESFKLQARKNEPSDSETSEPETENLDLESSEIPEDYKSEWQKFFAHSDADNEYIADLKNNLAEAKTKISEELSQYSGSVPGDLADFAGVENVDDLPEDVVNHIKLLRDVLKHYRSGPLPKTVKVLPHLPGWEGLLDMLKPLEWTLHVYPKVTKVFASKGHEPALYFYENCLLPRVRQDIEENRRLSVHLFEALITSMFRPEEFVSGVFLPWIQSEMTKTEGVILAHLMKKASLKARFASVALALSLEEEFSVPRSLVIETLLSKRYHMPETALARVKRYFLSFDKDCTAYFTDENRMPVSWFRSLLLFLEWYRDSVDQTERAELLKLCRRHEHPQITAEIRSLLSLVPAARPITTTTTK